MILQKFILNFNLMADRNVKIINASGKAPFILPMAKVTTTAFDKNSLVELGATINPSDDNDTNVFGIIKEEVSTTDTDYSTAGATKNVEIIQAGDLVEIDSTAALTIGTSYGISNAYTVDATDITNDIFTPIKQITTTRYQGFMKALSAIAVQ
jgi:hypothetical protein